MQRGVLYIASGNTDIMVECIHSAKSLRKHNPTLPIQLVTDEPLRESFSGFFDYVDIRPKQLHPLKAKVRYLNESRFGTTMFLDADTEVRAPIGHLFDDPAHNLSVTFDNLCEWNPPVRLLAQESNVINTGFLLYDSSPGIRAVFSKWYQLLLQQDETDMRPGHNCDQEYFNQYLRDSVLNDKRIKVRILPNDVYNVRPWCWEDLRRKGKFSETKILHAHHLNHGFFEKIKRKITSIFPV